MKKTIAAILLLISVGSAQAYFDGGINYTSGKEGYNGQDVYLTVGRDGFWVKPEYSGFKSDNYSSYRKYSARVGFEKKSYTFSVLAGMIPEVEQNTNKYKNRFVGADITFAFNPTSGSMKRMSGPNSGYASRSGEGVTQIELGAGVVYTGHTYNGSNFAQMDASFFAAAKVLMAQLSASYTASSYDRTLKSSLSGLQRGLGLNYYYTGFPRSGVNVKIDLLGMPMVTPFVIYNKLAYKFPANTDDRNTYGAGAYVDLNMVTAMISYQTYKDTGSNRQNFISVSAGMRF